MSELITMDKRDLIKAFRDYQKEWLYSHHDFELSPMLEEVIAKFLDDTAERFMVEKSQLLEEGTTKDATSDLISKKEATTIPVMPKEHREYQTMNLDDAYEQGWFDCQKCIEELPSAEPERTCVNCGRTANNGGWYADGGTRCPIEEHYALPKDGYCHLWEKRNVTDDDYPERREE